MEKEKKGLNERDKVGLEYLIRQMKKYHKMKKYSLAEIRHIMKVFVSAAADIIKEDKDLRLVDFGTFKGFYTDPFVVRNPLNLDTEKFVMSKSRLKVKYIPSVTLVRYLNDEEYIPKNKDEEDTDE